MAFARRGGHESHRLHARDGLPSPNASVLIERPLKSHRGVGEVGSCAEPTAGYEPPNPIEDRPGGSRTK